jgi:hypothetical protein
MSEPETLASLASDLRALPARQRRAILSALSGFERSRVTLLLQQEEFRARAHAEPVPADFGQFSPWLGKYLEHAEGAPETTVGGRNVTPATRRLLLQAAGEAKAGTPRVEAGRTAPAKRRSLLDAVGGLLSPNRVPL